MAKLTKDYAKFEVKCDRIGFSRSYEFPLDARGYVHQLADDLSRAMDFYQLRIQLHDKDQERGHLKAMLEKWAESFYCDGETKEKAELKELRFNQFVEMWENFNRHAERASGGTDGK